MRRSRQVVAASAFAAALFVPAIPLAAQEAGTSPETAADPATTAPAPETAPAVTAEEPPAAPPAAAPPAAAPPPAPGPEPAAEPEPEPAANARVIVRAAASKSVTIKDFSFAPSTISIGVGDTVTWTNQGPSIHTATANNGSFDSGNLDKGKSYSKTFSSAGTISYICRPHPFMTGKIVVASGSSGGGSNGSGGGGGGSSGGGSTGADANSAASAGTSGGLPNTGTDVVPWSLFGFSLLVFGAALRWRLNAD